jgi:hypothetical protein
MPSVELSKIRLETESIVVGYAMSRLDVKYLAARKLSTWQQAFAEASNSLTVKGTSFKNLRDEFDPYHCNPRAGWHGRDLRMNRQRVMDELGELSDDALLELVATILKGKQEIIVEAIDSLAVVNKTAHNVAERLLTGRLAEEYFLNHSAKLVGVDPNDILDLRDAACGYDFGVKTQPDWAIEVKGLKKTKGEILFTDHEWAEAKRRSKQYWLVVVGNLSATPKTRLIVDPGATLPAICRYRQTVAVTWHSSVNVSEHRITL